MGIFAAAMVLRKLAGLIASPQKWVGGSEVMIKRRSALMWRAIAPRRLLFLLMWRRRGVWQLLRGVRLLQIIKALEGARSGQAHGLHSLGIEALKHPTALLHPCRDVGRSPVPFKTMILCGRCMPGGMQFPFMHTNTCSYESGVCEASNTNNALKMKHEFVAVLHTCHNSKTHWHHRKVA